MDLCPVDEQLQKLAQSVSRATSLEELTRPLLGLLQRITGLQSTYLTTIDQAAARSSDLPSRFGGDEFVVVASSDVTEHPAYERDKIAERLADALSGVIQLDDVTLNYAGPSVGVISWQKGNPGDADSVIADADKAMYRVKKRRRSGLSS